MTPSETFVKAVNSNPRGSMVTIGGISLAAILSMVATVFGLGHKVGDARHEIETNHTQIMAVDKAATDNMMNIISIEKSQAVLISEFENLQKDLEGFMLEQKTVNREILDELRK